MTSNRGTLAVWKWGLFLSLWAGGLYGVLQVAKLPGNWGHWICGPWGCGPRLQALIACHGFWLVLLFPAAIAINSTLHASQVRLVGSLLAGSGAASVLMVAVIQGLTWLPATHSPLYFGQRILFSIAMLVEIPIVQILAIGLFLRRRATLRERRASEQADEA